MATPTEALLDLAARRHRAGGTREPFYVTPDEWRALWLRFQETDPDGGTVGPAPDVPPPGTTLFGITVVVDAEKAADRADPTVVFECRNCWRRGPSPDTIDHRLTNCQPDQIARLELPATRGQPGRGLFEPPEPTR